MPYIMCCIYQGNRSLAALLFQDIDQFTVLSKFLFVPFREFLPFCRVMSKTFPEIAAWCYLLHPEIEVSICLFLSPSAISVRRAPGIRLPQQDCHIPVSVISFLHHFSYHSSRSFLPDFLIIWKVIGRLYDIDDCRKSDLEDDPEIREFLFSLEKAPGQREKAQA